MTTFNPKAEILRLRTEQKIARRKKQLYCKKTPYDKYKVELISLWREEDSRLADLVRFLQPMFPKIHHQQVTRALQMWGVKDA